MSLSHFGWFRAIFQILKNVSKLMYNHNSSGVTLELCSVRFSVLTKMVCLPEHFYRLGNGFNFLNTC